MNITLLADRRTRHEFIRFLAIGVKGNLIYIGLFVGLTSVGLDQRIALTAVYVFATAYTFLFNKYYVFKVEGRLNLRQIWRHLALYSGIWLINIAFFEVLAMRLRINGYAVQLLFAAFMAVVVFACCKYFVFRLEGRDQVSAIPKIFKR